jgi:hypothetical protein
VAETQFKLICSGLELEWPSISSRGLQTLSTVTSSESLRTRNLTSRTQLKPTCQSQRAAGCGRGRQRHRESACGRRQRRPPAYSDCRRRPPGPTRRLSVTVSTQTTVTKARSDAAAGRPGQLDSNLKPGPGRLRVTGSLSRQAGYYTTTKIWPRPGTE